MDNHVITSMLYHRVLSSVAIRKHVCQLNSVDQDKKLAMPAFQDSIRQPSHIEVRSLNRNSFWAIHCLISSVTSRFTFVQVLPVPSNFRIFLAFTHCHFQKTNPEAWAPWAPWDVWAPRLPETVLGAIPAEQDIKLLVGIATIGSSPPKKKTCDLGSSENRVSPIFRCFMIFTIAQLENNPLSSAAIWIL